MPCSFVKQISYLRKRPLSIVASVVFGIYLLFHLVGPATDYYAFPAPHPTIREQNAIPSPDSSISGLSVDLVIASVSGDDTSWASRLSIPGLNIVRYVSDDRLAKYHPPKAKGREALMYLTYLHQFYDSLPDVSIFVHADELAWHVEGTLLQNTSFALSQLDLGQVIKRQYFNLRVTWRAACPDWIDTTKTINDGDKQEEPYMREAWAANFGDDPIPDRLGGPCCSQFAVSRAAIRRRPKEQYQKSAKWLVQTKLSDHISGRVWEHMWPRLFTDIGSDCSHPERQSLCEMYALCFQTDEELDDYKELWEERERLKERMSFFQAMWSPSVARAARRQMDVVNIKIEVRLGEAWHRGQNHTIRAEALDIVDPQSKT